MTPHRHRGEEAVHVDVRDHALAPGARLWQGRWVLARVEDLLVAVLPRPDEVESRRLEEIAYELLVLARGPMAALELLQPLPSRASHRLRPRQTLGGGPRRRLLHVEGCTNGSDEGSA